MSRDHDRYQDYRPITARYAGRCSALDCGGTVVKGDSILYNAQLRKLLCTPCSLRWEREVAAEAMGS